MELVIKTKATESNPFGTLKIYTYNDNGAVNFECRFTKKQEEYEDNYYCLELINTYNEQDAQTKKWHLESFSHTFDLTEAQCDSPAEYLEWLKDNIEFILVNGTFYFQSDAVGGGEDDTIDDSILSQNLDLAAMLSS